MNYNQKVSMAAEAVLNGESTLNNASIQYRVQQEDIKKKIEHYNSENYSEYQENGGGYDISY